MNILVIKEKIHDIVLSMSRNGWQEENWSFKNSKWWLWKRMIVLRALWMKTTQCAISSAWKNVIRFKELRNTHQGYHKVASEMDWTISNEDILHFDMYVLDIDTKGTRSGIMCFMFSYWKGIIKMTKFYICDERNLDPHPSINFKMAR